MRGTISRPKLFKILEWILFVGFIIASGCFVSGVLENFFSRKTSFSQHKEKITEYPVLNILFGQSTSEVNLSDFSIIYKASGMPNFRSLEIGDNHLHNRVYNKTEKVILERLENWKKYLVFRIIHETPILDEDRPMVETIIEYNGENQKITSKNVVTFFITSRSNSPGLSFNKWKDGKPLEITINKNHMVKYGLQPQITKYLKEIGECQEESYYECIASQLDVMEFNKCPKKCIPNAFSNLGRNYSTPFCSNDTENEYCAMKIVRRINRQEIASDCKSSCSNLEYFGEFGINRPISSNIDKIKNWNAFFKYKLVNQDLNSMVYEEYIIYDTVGMIGSVGGTFGNFLNYIFKNNLNYQISKKFYSFRNVHRIFIYWCSCMDSFIS